MGDKLFCRPACSCTQSDPSPVALSNTLLCWDPAGCWRAAPGRFALLSNQGSVWKSRVRHAGMRWTGLLG